MLYYSDIVKEKNRFMGTSDVEEYHRWVRILDDNLIRYKVTAKSPASGRFDFRFELIGYSKEDNERIRDLVGYYYDEEDAE